MQIAAFAIVLVFGAIVQAEETRVASEKELVEEDGTKVSFSLPTESDAEAWDEPGFRVALGYSHGNAFGHAPALDLTLDAFNLRILARIDRWWSLGVDFQYALARGTMQGLRYGTTLQAVLHPRRFVAVAFGVGLGGLVLQPPMRSNVRPGNGEEVASVTFGPDAKLGECTGSAWVGLARGEYQWVVGALFASGPFAEVHTQYTRCEQALGRLDRETGRQIVGRQWWLQAAVEGGWWFSWR